MRVLTDYRTLFALLSAMSAAILATLNLIMDVPCAMYGGYLAK